ncbi:MAG TPA: SAM-dependent methyltransferase [Acidobacteriaceae bacterium]|nr:SAM-dependent methyltransferase [Acidobacteriaceae bacterium]
MESDVPGLDIETPHPSRMYDYYLGGKDNWPADRDAARRVIRAVPEIQEMARENRAFLQRVVRYLIRDAGIRQIIDIGTGLPTAGNVHEVAQQVDPGTRIVCVDNDPLVHTHARVLLAGTGPVAHVLADARDPESILTNPQVRDLIDFRQPVGLLMVAILHFIPDANDPASIIAAFRERLAPGSQLALSHGTSDLHTAAKVHRATAAYEPATAPLVLRTRRQILTFFGGWRLIDPGLVQVPLWRPDVPVPPPDVLAKLGIYGGVGIRA